MHKPGPKTSISEKTVVAARHIIDELSYTNRIISAFVILLVDQGKLTQAEIAEIVGISVATVKRVVNAGSQLSNDDCQKRSTTGWGGDRRSLLSTEKARSLLDGFAAEAKEGSLVTVDKIRERMEVEVGHAVTPQTVYNLLYRNRWRKVVPDKHHPRNSPEKMDEFKKKRFPTRYIWLPPKQESEIAN